MTSTDGVDLLVARQSFAQVRELFERAPQVCGFHARDALSHALAHIRNQTFRTSTMKGRARAKKSGWLPFRAWPFPTKRASATRKLFANWHGTLDEVNGRILDRFAAPSAQEFGASVRPTGGPYLTIPLARGLRKLGIPIGTPAARGWRKKSGLYGLRSRANAGRGSRAKISGLGLFVKKQRNGKLTLFAKRQQDPRPIAIMRLVTHVTIPPRLGAEATAQREAGWIDQRFQLAGQRIIDHLDTKGAQL